MHDLTEKMKEQIEQKCILNIPERLLKDVLKYSLDEEYALDYNNFVEGEFFHPGSSARENSVINRLYNFLKDNERI